MQGSAWSRGSWEIDVNCLLSGNNTACICSLLKDQARLAPAFGGLVNDLMTQMYEREEVKARQVAEHPVIGRADATDSTTRVALASLMGVLPSSGLLGFGVGWLVAVDQPVGDAAARRRVLVGDERVEVVDAADLVGVAVQRHVGGSGGHRALHF